MAERQNTGNPVPSNDLKDLNDNTIIIDEWTNGAEDYTQDRLGNQIKTRKKVVEDLDAYAQQIADGLFVPLDGSTAAEKISLKDGETNLYLTAKDGELAINDKTVSTATYAVGDKIWHFSRQQIEDGQVALDGQLLNRVDYSELFDLLSPIAISDSDWIADPTKRGLPTLGDDSTNFRLPDLNGKQEGSILSPFLRGDGKKDAGSIAKHALDKNLKCELYTDKNASDTSVIYLATGMAVNKSKTINNNTARYNTSSSSPEQTYTEINAANIGDVDDDTHPNEAYVVWCIVAKGKTRTVNNDGSIPTLTGSNKWEGTNDFHELKQKGSDVVTKANIGEQLLEIGVGQTWRDVTTQRTQNVIYQNTTGKPIQLSIDCATPDSNRACVFVGASSKSLLCVGYGTKATVSQQYPIIPDRYYYKNVASFDNWLELR